MALNAKIGGRRHTVSPRTRIELSATRDDASEIADCGILAVSAVTALGIATGLRGSLPYGAGRRLGALPVLVLMALGPATVSVSRLRTNAAAWSVPPVLAERARPSQGQWGEILTVGPRGVTIIAALTISRLLGPAVVSLGSGTPIQIIGLLLIAPGSIMFSFASTVVATALLAHLMLAICRPPVASAQRHTT